MPALTAATAGDAAAAAIGIGITGGGSLTAERKEEEEEEHPVRFTPDPRLQSLAPTHPSLVLVPPTVAERVGDEVHARGEKRDGHSPNYDRRNRCHHLFVFVFVFTFGKNK